jgi:hypothetical protein
MSRASPNGADGRPAYAINATVKMHEDNQSGEIVALEIQVEESSRVPLRLAGAASLSAGRRHETCLEGHAPARSVDPRPSAGVLARWSYLG